jgi:hypothetical protein
MIGGALTHLVSLAKALKLAYEDCAKQTPQLVANWRELRAATDKDVRGLIAAIYRNIYSFVQLLQFYR